MTPRWPHIIDCAGGRLIISQLRTGEISVMVDHGRGTAGVLLKPLDASEVAAVLISCAKR
jgi:hypothetical protein